MKSWPDRRIIDLLGIATPIIQAPMAGVDSAALAVGVTKAGGLGSLACAMRSPEQVRQALAEFRRATDGPVNLNFFCHRQAAPAPQREQRWQEALGRYYQELGVEPAEANAASARRGFDAATCRLIEEVRPPVVSFHFGLPDAVFIRRIKHTGVKILSSATSVQEALWLEAQGCDAVIAQGYEAGGHRGFFLSDTVYTQTGTMALVPQIADAVKIPVIASGGIADGRGIAAACMLGAAAVQLGTAYLFCPEAEISPLYQQALQRAGDGDTVITNLFSGGAARGISNRFIREMGPLSPLAPQFPLAGAAVAPLRKQSEASGSTDFMQMWAGQAAALGHEAGAEELTLALAQAALNKLSSAGR